MSEINGSVNQTSICRLGIFWMPICYANPVHMEHPYDMITSEVYQECVKQATSSNLVTQLGYNLLNLHMVENVKQIRTTINWLMALHTLLCALKWIVCLLYRWCRWPWKHGARPTQPVTSPPPPSQVDAFANTQIGGAKKAMAQMSSRELGQARNRSDSFSEGAASGMTPPEGFKFRWYK